MAKSALVGFRITFYATDWFHDIPGATAADMSLISFFNLQ